MSDSPWRKSESAYLWNHFLAGVGSLRIAAGLLCNRARVRRRLKRLIYNERDSAIRYVPSYRTSRKGLRFTENEKLILKEHKNRNVPLEATARLLCRDVSEINEDWKQVPEVKALTVLAPSLDLVMAHRYLYHQYKTPIISDKSYDALYKEEVEYGGGRAALTAPGEGPRRIRGLALYLIERYEDEHGHPPPKRKK